MSKNACGPHTDLVSNNAVRVSRCTCGTLHVTLVASGVTLRMTPDVFRSVTAGLRAAAEKTEEQPTISATGSSSIN